MTNDQVIDDFTAAFSAADRLEAVWENERSKDADEERLCDQNYLSNSAKYRAN